MMIKFNILLAAVLFCFSYANAQELTDEELYLLADSAAAEVNIEKDELIAQADRENDSVTSSLAQVATVAVVLLVIQLCMVYWVFKSSRNTGLPTAQTALWVFLVILFSALATVVYFFYLRSYQRAAK